MEKCAKVGLTRAKWATLNQRSPVVDLQLWRITILRAALLAFANIFFTSNTTLVRNIFWTSGFCQVYIHWIEELVTGLSISVSCLTTSRRLLRAACLIVTWHALIARACLHHGCIRLRLMNAFESWSVARSHLMQRNSAKATYYLHTAYRLMYTFIRVTSFIHNNHLIVNKTKYINASRPLLN